MMKLCLMLYTWMQPIFCWVDLCYLIMTWNISLSIILYHFIEVRRSTLCTLKGESTTEADGSSLGSKVNGFLSRY
ncbi:Uncharacterized protein TCM_013301 [Theobroma cacao]|uniref:Uncharacterized protein n=1 Tax=Theobroma cacao TaxID=3641 RepID=A0A061FWU9_THECC|nr:Uncharacterized protein TCM_013301 [Theobroma cacao]